MLVVDMENFIFMLAIVAMAIIIKWLKIKWKRWRNSLKKGTNGHSVERYTETLEDDALYYPVEEEE